MKTIKIDLSKELKGIELHTFADEHIGDEHSDIKRVLQRIEYVKNTPNAYCILNGVISVLKSTRNIIPLQANG